MEPTKSENLRTDLSNINTNKTLLALRGIPGSGKTSLAKALSLTNGAPIFSIDSYFENEVGEYHFDYQKNHLAYKDCESKTKQALEHGVPFVIVDNTFTLDWELSPYTQLAKEFGYRFHVVTVENRHGGKNVHQIPDEQIEKMKAKYQVVL
ncbi:ATP-binding protein [Leptospira kanakyensis]|uniref:ATP-binding protein n=1 Tax=Leptospira kanakyensis TaxID=2484968 RepID=A0A6N4Q9P3_9LEPT|nr:ATP-binding protein [Leptospira kanakyensis]MCW7468786.1 ATP-binding protein [Leptospira kanakyensis]MCW7479779.1 ATP-binding protein [Leptospira kanakyensis]TGK50013.1 ATP-binding protein [Leptospira kanakyensis]TGK58470.1 ATP-binding protein [Leptospira kanakyensis]TGK69151.1 ATP-binding protein [Leptospira kanakyensis]